jgi:hypothetical protein
MKLNITRSYWLLDIFNNAVLIIHFVYFRTDLRLNRILSFMLIFLYVRKEICVLNDYL